MSDELIARLVKPLEWKTFTDNVSYIADSSIGEYVVEGAPGRFWMFPMGMEDDDGTEYETVASAKSAAQADYAARILAALDTDALARLTAEHAALKAKAEGLAEENNTLRRALFGQGGQNPVRVDGTPYYPKGPGND